MTHSGQSNFSATPGENLINTHTVQASGDAHKPQLVDEGTSSLFERVKCQRLQPKAVSRRIRTRFVPAADLFISFVMLLFESFI